MLDRPEAVRMRRGVPKNLQNQKTLYAPQSHDIYLASLSRAVKKGNR
jgi:hypothetical protein